MIRLTGFGGLEPDWQWTDGEVATVSLRLANPTGKERLDSISRHLSRHIPSNRYG